MPAQTLADKGYPTRSRNLAAVLAIIFGAFGFHKFYLGYNTTGFVMLGVTLVGSLVSMAMAGLVMYIIAVIEGLTYLSYDQARFEEEYVTGRKEWF